MVLDWNSHKTDTVGIREESKDVFSVQLVTVKGAGDIDASLNLYLESAGGDLHQHHNEVKLTSGAKTVDEFPFVCLRFAG